MISKQHLYEADRVLNDLVAMQQKLRKLQREDQQTDLEIREEYDLKGRMVERMKELLRLYEPP